MDRELIDCIDAGTEYCPSVTKEHHFIVKKS